MEGDDQYREAGLTIVGAAINTTVELERGDLRAAISPLGAELRSLSSRDVEYLWPAQDPWKRTAPLFVPYRGQADRADEVIE